MLDKINKIDDIPTLPTVAIEIIGLAQSPDVQINKLSEVIHQDPPLATKVLKAANSAYYRRATSEVETIQRAIMLLGLNEIVDITSTISVFSAFPVMDREAHSIRLSFWNHCVATGIIAKYLAKKLKIMSDGKEFVGGLLHDVGKIILDEYFHDSFTAARSLASERHCPMLDAEREILGTDHSEVGYLLAAKWHLPAYIADIIQWHHDPAQAKFKELTSLVSLANLLAKGAEMSFGGDIFSFVLDEQPAWRILRDKGYPMDDIDIARLTFEISDVEHEVSKYISSFTDNQEGE